MNEIEYEIVFRSEKKIRYIQNITELKVEGGAYLFYSGSFVSYSVPVDCVEEINSP